MRLGKILVEEFGQEEDRCNRNQEQAQQEKCLNLNKEPNLNGIDLSSHPVHQVHNNESKNNRVYTF